MALLTVVVLAVAGVLVARAGSGGVIVRDEDGCPRSVGAASSVSWMDVVRVDGRTYQRVDVHGPSTVAADHLGEQVGTVDCTIGEDVQSPGYELRDGEATFLPVGSRVHALARTDPAFRVAVVADGPPVVYEHRVPRAAIRPQNVPVAADRVTAVVFVSEQDGQTPLGRITDPEEVAAFVAELNRAGASLEPPRDLGDEPRVFIDLALRDQPAYRLVAYPDRRITVDGIELTDALLSRLPPEAG